MTEMELTTIELFAGGASHLRGEAIEIHRNALRAGERDTLHQKFMSEVDNPAPDLLLRARYREALLRGDHLKTPSTKGK